MFMFISSSKEKSIIQVPEILISRSKNGMKLLSYLMFIMIKGRLGLLFLT